MDPSQRINGSNPTSSTPTSAGSEGSLNPLTLLFKTHVGDKPLTEQNPDTLVPSSKPFIDGLKDYFGPDIVSRILSRYSLTEIQY